MLDTLFGSRSAARVLLFLASYHEGYASEIARVFNMPVNLVQKQLNKFEDDGIVVSLNRGKTRVFTWNPRWPLKQELISLLKKSLDLLPESEVSKYYRMRRRPRRRNKPL